MQLRFRTLIRCSPREVWAAFESLENRQRWQPALKAMHHIEGQPGQEGAISSLSYIENGKEIIVRERIRYREEGVALDFEYISPVAFSVVENRFLPAEGGTMWVVEARHRFRGLHWFLALFIGSTIERRMQADLNRFKALVEKR